MFIAIDGISASLPDDVRALGDKSRQLRSAAKSGQQYSGGGDVESVITSLEAGAPPATGFVLDRWDVQSHQYKSEAKADMSILAKLFSSDVEGSRYGVVQEAKRYCIQTTEDNRRVEYGSAVRLSVAVIGGQADFSLTLPNIAAKAQLSHLQARIALSVDGYTGPLGDLLPAPDNLNVENLAVYTKAFKDIQARVFGAEGLGLLSPTLLGYEEQDALAHETTMEGTAAGTRSSKRK